VRRLLTVSFLAAVVFAMLGSASAHVFVGHTSINIQGKPSGRVSAGQTVTISGRLVGRLECRANQRIELINLTTGAILTTTTDAQGRYTFQVTVTENSAFQAHFEGSRRGVHPHAHVCSASTSRVLAYVVRGSGSPSSGATREGSDAGTDVLAAGGSNEPPTTDAVTATGGDGTAFAGSDAFDVVVVAALLFVIGTSAVVVGRRRRPTNSEG